MIIYFAFLASLELFLCDYNLNSPIYVYNPRNNNLSSHSNLTYLPIQNILKKNLILSIIVGYSLDNILPFIKSIIRSNFQNCDIVIFVKNISQEVIDCLKSYGIIIYEISTKFNKLEVTLYRWKLYLDFLEKNKQKYHLVLSIDIRDSIAQKDIFAFYNNSKPFLALFLEDGILNETFNKNWMINIYGVELHKIISDKTIINAGIILGTLNIFIAFLNILWKNILAFPKAVDQSIINYLIYKDKIFEDYIILNDNCGPVMTIGLTKRENIILDSEYNILNFEGQIASIVHQYDRHKDLLILFKKKFFPECLKDMVVRKNNYIFLFLLEIFMICLLIKIYFSSHNLIKNKNMK